MRKTPALEKLGHEIRERRLARHLTQQGLAQASGVETNTIGMIERAQSESQILTLFRVARGLEMPLADLIAAVERR